MEWVEIFLKTPFSTVEAPCGASTVANVTCLHGFRGFAQLFQASRNCHILANQREKNSQTKTSEHQSYYLETLSVFTHCSIRFKEEDNIQSR
jgi:hypothetical protein